MALWRLGRYRFLVGGFVLYAFGAALARRVGGIDVGAYVLGQTAISVTQLMTHYCNDYFDVEADRANATPTTWSGGSGVLRDGALSPTLARNVAIVLGLTALFLIAIIAAGRHGSTGLPLILLLALVMSWEYSAPPLRLHSHGLGPATAGLVVGGLTPLVGYGMQGAPWTTSPLLAVAPLVVGQFALVLVLDFPDAAGDARTGKRTLVVLLGQTRAIRVAIAAVVLTYVLVTGPFVGGEKATSLERVGMLATLPLAVWLAGMLLRGEWRRSGASVSAKARLTWLAVIWFALLSFAALVGAALDAAHRS